MEQPLISVLMGVYYQRASLELLETAVRSVLEQDWRNLELLVCDEGSSPAAREFLEALARQDGRLRLVQGENKRLLPEKLNACLRVAKGDWIARMDDDDYSCPQRLMRQMEFLERHSEIAFVGCQVEYVTIEGSIPSQFPARPTPTDFYFSMPFIHPALLFRREALERVGGYDESPVCHLCEDYDLLLRLYEQDLQGANLDECLFRYSLAGTEGNRRSLSARMNEARVRYRHFHALGLLPGAFPYVVKPLTVALLPRGLLNHLRRNRLEESK